MRSVRDMGRHSLRPQVIVLVFIISSPVVAVEPLPPCCRSIPSLESGTKLVSYRGYDQIASFKRHWQMPGPGLTEVRILVTDGYVPSCDKTPKNHITIEDPSALLDVRVTCDVHFKWLAFTSAPSPTNPPSCSQPTLYLYDPMVLFFTLLVMF